METIADLTEEYQRWCKEHGVTEPLSADELLVSPNWELDASETTWVCSFIERWNRAQQLEDERERLARHKNEQPTTHLAWEREDERGRALDEPVLMQWWAYDNKRLRELHRLPTGEWREVETLYHREYDPT